MAFLGNLNQWLFPSVVGSNCLSRSFTWAFGRRKCVPIGNAGNPCSFLQSSASAALVSGIDGTGLCPPSSADCRSGIERMQTSAGRVPALVTGQVLVHRMLGRCCGLLKPRAASLLAELASTCPGLCCYGTVGATFVSGAISRVMGPTFFDRENTDYSRQVSAQGGVAARTVLREGLPNGAISGV